MSARPGHGPSHNQTQSRKMVMTLQHLSARTPRSPARRLGALFVTHAFCAVLLAGASAAHAQSTRLSALLDWAKAADAQFLAARAAAESGREKLPQALAGARPSVNASYSNKANSDGSSQYVGTRGYHTENAALTLNQPLYRPFVKLGIEQASAQVQQSERQLALAEQELLLRIAKAYFDVLQAQDELAASSAQKDALAWRWAPYPSRTSPSLSLAMTSQWHRRLPRATS
jgi:outer membrane protein